MGYPNDLWSRVGTCAETPLWNLGAPSRVLSRALFRRLRSVLGIIGFRIGAYTVTLGLSGRIHSSWTWTLRPKASMRAPPISTDPRTISQFEIQQRSSAPDHNLPIGREDEVIQIRHFPISLIQANGAASTVHRYHRHPRRVSRRHTGRAVLDDQTGAR